MTTVAQHVLCIDLGTSGPKVAIVSADGEVRAHAFAPVDLELSPGGGAEQSPEKWWQAIGEASRKTMESGADYRDQIGAVSVTAQWSGTVPVDSQGDAIGNAIIWMDSRGAKYIEKKVGGALNISGYGIHRLPTLLRLTGGVPGLSGKDPVSHILWLQHERPEVYEQARYFLEPKDYLNMRLTGEVAASFDSIVLHWVTDNRDPNNVSYSEKLLRIMGLDGEKLPPLRPATEVLGALTDEAAKFLGAPAGLPVMTGTPDMQSAALGSGAVRDFETHLYVGTSSWISGHVPFKKADVIRNVASLPAALPGRYFVANEQETSGACLNALANNWLFPKDSLSDKGPGEDIFQRFDKAAAAIAPGAENLIFTPWLNGERSPMDDHTTRGGFYNMSLKTTREHMVRAVFEGVAFNTRLLLGAVEHFMGDKIPAINIIGGGAKSDVWCQIFADILDRPIRQVEDPIHANARGAAFVAALGLGWRTVDELSKSTPVSQTFEPTQAHREQYDRLFGTFQNIYSANKTIYKRLNKQ